MDTKTLSYVAPRMWAAIAVVLGVLSTPVALAQTPAPNMADHKQKMAAQEAMTAMMAKMAAADQRLADLVAKMNAAKGEERIAAMAAVVNELVAQQKQMRESCEMMKKAPAAAIQTEPDHGAHHPDK